MRIIQRHEWGARHPDGFRNAPIPAVQMWLHHSVTIAPDLVPPFTDDYEAIRRLEKIGQDRFGGGMSYTWPITPAGLIFEGHSVWRQGSHTGGRNDIARAICFVGNYENQKPTNAQLDAAAWLLRHAKAKGWIKYAKLDGGHRDLKATACPGRHAYAQIAEINRRAASSTPAPPEEDVMTPEQEKKLDFAIRIGKENQRRIQIIRELVEHNLGYTGKNPKGGVTYPVGEVDKTVPLVKATGYNRSDHHTEVAQLAAMRADDAARDAKIDAILAKLNEDADPKA